MSVASLRSKKLQPLFKEYVVKSKKRKKKKRRKNK